MKEFSLGNKPLTINGYMKRERVTYMKENQETKTSFTKSDNNLRLKIIKECGYKEFAMYMTILSHRNTQSGNCYPSISCLADEMDCTPRTIYNLINSLYDLGFIIINSGRTGINNTYYFPYESFYKQDEESGSMAKRRKNVFSDKVNNKLKDNKKQKGDE